VRGVEIVDREQPQGSFGVWLRRRRETLDLTRDQLARQVACSISTLRKLEAEERRPSRLMAERLSEVLQVAVDDRPAFLRFARGDPFSAPPAGGLAESYSPASPVPAAAQADPRAKLRHNLPLQLTRFFGREPEIAQIKERLAEWRLVSLTGPGGVGKTRLSLRAAEEALADFAAGVWFVDLAPLSDPSLVPQQVLASLGLPDEPGRPSLETLAAHLRDRQALVVLDNCEHLLEACAGLASSLMRACPQLRLLATSREALGLGAESVFPVPSLPFPNPGQAIVSETLIDYDAVRLFVDRARRVQPNYEVTPRNAHAVARICQRLDGIPFALELAAAHLRLLTSAQLAGRLDDSLRLLTGGDRAAAPRQQTLRATIEWSYDLLSPNERLLLQRLSVFAGGCTLEAAEAVCADAAGASLAAAQVYGVLASLVDQSMVVAERRPGEESRYHLLETVRQYAGDKLHEAGDSARLSQRHYDYFLCFAESNVPKTCTKDRLIWERKLLDERDNFRRALEWSFSGRAEVEAGPRLLYVLKGGYPWPTFQEWRDWSQRVVTWCQTHAAIPDFLYAELLGWAAGPLARDDLPTALDWMHQSVDISRRLGPEHSELHWCLLLGLARFHLSERGDGAPALAPLAEAEALLAAGGLAQLAPERYEGEMALLATDKAELAIRQGRYQDAKVHAREAIRRLAVSGEPWSGIRPLILLGDACQNLGEYQQARDTFLEALALIEESGDREKAYVLRWLGLVDLKQGRLERALDYCRASLREAERYGDPNIMASCLGVCPGIAAKAGHRERAARLSGAAKALYARQRRNAWEDSSLATLLPGWQAAPDQAALAQAFAAGEAMDMHKAVALALGEG
jgi:non-specific serine/threonine protein kinase